MTFAWNIDFVSYAVAAAILGGLGLRGWRHRHTEVGAPFVLMMGSLSIWMQGAGMASLGASLLEPAKLN